MTTLADEAAGENFKTEQCQDYLVNVDVDSPAYHSIALTSVECGH